LINDEKKVQYSNALARAYDEKLLARADGELLLFLSLIHTQLKSDFDNVLHHDRCNGWIYSHLYESLV